MKYSILENTKITIDSKFTFSSKKLNDSAFYDLNGFYPNKSIERDEKKNGLNQSYLMAYTYQNSSNAFLNAELAFDIYDESLTQDIFLNDVIDRTVESDLSKRYVILKIDILIPEMKIMLQNQDIKGVFFPSKNNMVWFPVSIISDMGK